MSGVRPWATGGVLMLRCGPTCLDGVAAAAVAGDDVLPPWFEMRRIRRWPKLTSGSSRDDDKGGDGRPPMRRREVVPPDGDDGPLSSDSDDSGCDRSKLMCEGGPLNESPVKARGRRTAGGEQSRRGG